MNDVKERLERLDEEASALAAKVKDAWKVYRSTKDPEDKQRYEDLKEKEKQLLPLLLEERRALQAKLPGAGERSPPPACSVVSVLEPPMFAPVIRVEHSVMTRLGMAVVSRPEQHRL